MHALSTDIGQPQASCAQSLTAKGSHHDYTVRCQHCCAMQSKTVLQMLKQLRIVANEVEERIEAGVTCVSGGKDGVRQILLWGKGGGHIPEKLL